MTNTEHDQWAVWRESWKLSLHQKAGDTVKSYLRAYDLFAAWCRGRAIDGPLHVTRADMRLYFAAYAERKNQRTGEPISRSTQAMDFRNLRVFYNWLNAEEDHPSPLVNVESPKAALRRVATFSDAQLRALLDTCKGRTFEDRRDAAILRVLFDGGPRRGELADMQVGDVDFGVQTIRVIGKGRGGRASDGGGKERLIPFGAKTGEALNRYLRMRAMHRDAARTDALWLKNPQNGAGPLLDNGISQMLARRARAAGVENVHPHRFRHTAYDAFADAGGDGTNAMAIFGWSSRSMLTYYAELGVERRALRQARRLSPGDRI
jgi:site-specific recombinase XerD